MMLSQGHDCQAVFSYLRSLNFHFLDKWVLECINYYKSTNPNISLEKLKEEVKQQWLLVNLRDLKTPSLPPNLKSQNKVILQGKYAVQVESMIDSSQSYYSQFQRLQKICTENLEVTEEQKQWEIKANRCLTFKICDGVQELEAMEYKPIKKIRSNDPELLPGFKMIIIGPVECRKGMVLLKEESVRICGGEVDTLTTVNNLKSILIRSLNINETDYPENFDSGSEEFKNDIIQSQDIQEPRSEGQNIENLLCDNEDVFLSLSLEPEFLTETQSQDQRKQTTDPVQNNLEKLSPIYIYDDDDFTSASKKHSLSPEDIHTPSPKKRSLNPEIKNSSFSPCETLSNLHSVPEEQIIHITQQSPSLNSCSSKVDKIKTKKSVQAKLSFFFKPDAPGTSSSDTEKGSVEKLKNTITVSSEPFVYLKQIMSQKLENPAIFKIKVIILTIKKKISIKNDRFNLNASITDGSSSVDVDFSTSVLEDLFGFSPCEMATMMKAKQTNSAMAERVKEILAKAQMKLISLNCLIRIQWFPEPEQTPVVLSLEEINLKHLKALRERKL